MRAVNRRNARFKLAVMAIAGTLALAVFIFNGHQTVEASREGPDPSYTNAPGEDNCTSCHTSYPVNSGEGSVQIVGIPHDYIPGQQYTVSVTTTHEGGVNFGFQLTAIDHHGQQAGNFSFTPQSPDVVQLMTNNFLVPPVDRQYIEHTTDGLFTDGVFGSNTWTFTWTAPAERIGKIDFYAAGNGANGSGGPTDDYIYTTSTSALSGTAISNFDSDLASDIAYFRPSEGVWYSYNILNDSGQEFKLGSTGDVIAPGDYDGDGQTDPAVFRPTTGTWYIEQSTLGYTEILWGSAGDVPTAGDYDGDGKTDTAVFRATTGEWLLNRSTEGPTTVILGQSGDKPAQGDYDGDGKTDVAVFRPGVGTWLINRSLLGPISVTFGSGDGRPVQADYDGDGKVDIAVFRHLRGGWQLLQSTDGAKRILFGPRNARPVPADYDGDGKADIAVFIPSAKKVGEGTWRILRSSNAAIYTTTMGLTTDVVVPGGYIAQ